MSKLAVKLEQLGYTLRSGHASGADTAFARDVRNADIYLPYHGFREKERNPLHRYIVVDEHDEEAVQSLAYHPAPSKLKPVAVKMMRRNFRQVIGRNAPNSQFVLCWTPGGKPVGGTSQAIRIAKAHNIPVFNLGDDAVSQKIQNSFIQNIGLFRK